MTLDADAQMREIDAAERRYQEARAALLRPDGTLVYTDHDERETSLWFDFRKDLSRITSAVDVATAEARATLAALAQADPTAGLTTDDLARADLRSRLLAEDARDLPGETVTARARAALEGGSRADRYAHLRVLRSLLRDLDPREGLALRTLADELAASLTDQTKRQAAERTLEAAGAVAAHIGATRYRVETYARPGRPATPARA